MYANKFLIVPPAGGRLAAVTADGEVVWEIGLNTGIHSSNQFLPFLPDGCDFEIEDGIQVYDDPARTARRVARPAIKRDRDSGANPNWRPSSDYKDQKQMRTVMRKQAEQQAKMQKRMADMERRFAEAENPVIEDDQDMPDEAGQVEADDAGTQDPAAAE